MCRMTNTSIGWTDMKGYGYDPKFNGTREAKFLDRISAAAIEQSRHIAASVLLAARREFGDEFARICRNRLIWVGYPGKR